MAILVDFGVAAPHQNYDVTSRASNEVGFFKNFNTSVFSPKCTILLSYSKIETGRVFLVHPSCYGGFFNVHVGTDTDTWKGVIGKHGVIGLNENRRYLLQLCCSN